jgi:DMSO reductase anchor subunit
MRPQFSIIFFTTLVGMAQGLLFFLALSNLYSQATPNAFLTHLGLPVAFILLCLSLIASRACMASSHDVENILAL